MKRETAFRPADPDDMKWLWAAYRKGWLRDVGVPEGLSVEQFDGVVSKLVQPHWGVSILSAPVAGREGLTPVGVLAAEPWGGRRFCGRVFFFPWASLRNKLTCVVNVVSRMRGVNLLVGTMRQDEVRFADHVCRYGIAKRAGTIQGWFDDGDNKDTALYQSKDLI